MYRKVNDESELDDVERRRGYENFPNTSLAVDSLPEVKTPKGAINSNTGVFTLNVKEETSHLKNFFFFCKVHLTRLKFC